MMTKVFVNGNWVGAVEDADYATTMLRDNRRKHMIEWEVSVVRKIRQQEVSVLCRRCVGCATLSLSHCCAPPSPPPHSCMSLPMLGVYVGHCSLWRRRS